MPASIELLERLTAKPKWAVSQINDLEVLLNDTFPRANPYGVRCEDDPNTLERTYYVTNLPDVPVEISLVAGDILQNLRSSLDHLVCHLVHKEGNPVTSQTAFPVANNAAEYISAVCRRKVKGAGQKAIDAIDAIEPYKGGKGAMLWRLHKLNNLDKHRLLLTACSTHVAHSLSPTKRKEMQELFRGSHPGLPVPDMRGHLINQPGSGPLKAGDKLLTVSQSELEENMQFLVDIAFDEPQIVECKPILPFFRDLAKAVFDIILGFDLNGLV